MLTKELSLGFHSGGRIRTCDLRIKKLRAGQEELLTTARRQKPLAEKALQKAQEGLRLVDTRIGQAAGLLTQLNNLESFIEGKPERSM